MGLTIIPNQPVNLLPTPEDACNIGDNKKYCTLYNNSDEAYLQWKSEPCGNDLMCDPTWRGGINLISNGAFDEGISGWTVDSTFSWDGGGQKMQCGGGAAFWFFPLNTLLTSVNYSISFTVSGRTAGTIRFRLGGINGTAGTLRSTNSTFTETVTFNLASTQYQFLEFDCSSTFDGKIDDVIIAPDSGCSVLGADWGYSSSGLVHTIGNTDPTYISILLSGYTGYQQIIIHITGMTTGSLYAGDGATKFELSDGTTAMNKNGTYTFYTTKAADFDLYLTPTEDFDGTVSETHVYELRRDYTIAANDSFSGVFLSDLTSYISYYEDRAILKIPANTFEDECIKLSIVDPCADLFGGVTNAELVIDTTFSTPGVWTNYTLGASNLVTGGEYKMTTINTPSNNQTFVYSDFATGITPGFYVFRIEFSVTAFESASSTAYIAVGFGDNLGYGLDPIYTLNNPQPNTTYTVFVIGEVLNYHTGVEIMISALSDSTNNHHNNITSFSLKYADVNSVTSIYGYESNCLAFKSSWDCAKLIKAYKESIGHSYGFYFPDDSGTIFKLTQRNRFIKFNPTYNIESEDARYTDGYRKYTYGEKEKFYDAKFDYCDETAHDAISTEILMDKFIIDGAQYFVKPEDYKPLWDKDEGQNLAQARIQLRKSLSTTYSNR
jgi:hypothetical protein